MPDVYATITQSERAVQERLADVIELRAADPRYQKMVRSYLSEIGFAIGTRAFEIGCGTGYVTRTLAQWPNVEHALGVDPSPVFIDRARTLAEGISNIAFLQADGRELPLESQSFEAVVIHTTMSHVPQRDRGQTGGLTRNSRRNRAPTVWHANAWCRRDSN